MDDNKQKSALQAYKTLCGALDKRNWHYEMDEENLAVSFGVSGDDIPMNFIVAIDAERQLIRLMSFFPFKVEKKYYTEIAKATCLANYRLADGSFDFDVSDGSIMFRMTSCFIGSLISADLITYMVDCACFTVDRFNDRFLMVAKGKMKAADIDDDF